MTPSAAPTQERRPRWTAVVAASDAAYYLLALVTVQGAAFAVQLVVAAALPPASFAVVRTVEAYLGPLLVIGAAGLPSLALAHAPQFDTQGQRALGRRLLLLSMLTGGVVALLTSLGATFLAPPLRGYLAATGGVIALAAVSRTLTNFLVGIGRLRALSLATAAVALVSVPSVLVLVRYSGIAGWVAGRYLVEGALLLVALALVGRGFAGSGTPLGERYAPRRLAATGAVLSASLLVRSVLDNLGPISAARLGFTDALIGSYSLATVGVTALLLVPGAFGNLAIRRFASLGRSAPAFRGAIWQGVLIVTLVTAVPCLAFAVLHDALLGVMFPEYLPGAAIMALVLWAAPFRALTALFGGVLVAIDHGADTLRLNLGCLVVGVALQWFLTQGAGLVGSAWAIVATDVVSALGYAALVVHRSRRVLAPPGTGA